MISKENFYLGKLKLSNRIFYAPLAGCSDFPFRKMSAKYSPGLMHCEMVKMEALVRYDAHTFHMLDYSAEMHPIAAQLCGSNPDLAAQSARIIENLGFDAIDLNCGCPVDKVTKDGSGSGMLKTPELIGEVLANMAAAVSIPVTVKIRAGWDLDQINAAEIVKIAEKAGAASICVHGRTRAQGYRGPANWDYIKACKEAANTIKVVGNGDVTDGHSAQKMFEYTGCDAVLVGRATMGQPWIVRDMLNFLSGVKTNPYSIEDCRQVLLEHYLCMRDYHNDAQICIDMRRVGCWYLKKASVTRQFRDLISRVSNVDEIEELIRFFPIGEQPDEEMDTALSDEQETNSS